MAESGDHMSDSNGAADDANLDEDPEVQQLQTEDDELAQRVSAEVSEELSSHISKLEHELKAAFDERMSAIHQQCSSQAAEVISTRQTDILQTNKILRDVSRGLGAGWRPVFESLMAQFSQDVRDGAVKKIEAERPFIQAYKALMIWKEASGPDFDIRHILDALRNNGLTELEQMTLNILDNNEKESLITFSGFGKKTSCTESVPCEEASAKDIQAAVAAVASATRMPSSNSSGMLDDRYLLQLAKRIFVYWNAAFMALAEHHLNLCVKLLLLSVLVIRALLSAFYTTQSSSADI